MHGDYRLDNCLVGDDDRIHAVVDWEMATLGDTRTDLALMLVYETLGRSDARRAGRPTSPRPPGYPDNAGQLAAYAAASGREPGDMGFHMALAYFKLAVILEGIHYRYLKGQTVGEGFDRIGEGFDLIVGAGLAELDALMDLSLTDEQQAFRALAREFLDREAVPHRAQWDRDESVDLAILPEDGRARLLRAHHPGGVRRRRRRLRDLRARHGGARPRRLVAARHRVGLQRAGRQVDPRVRHRGAEAGVAAADRVGRGARLLRPHRAGRRVGRGQPDLARRPRRATTG